MNSGDVELLLKVLTPLLVVGGWFFVYRVQSRQARLKLLRETAEKTREAVSDLLEAAISFHTKNYDDEKRVAITLALTHLEKRYELFPKIAEGRNSCFPAVDPKLVKISPSFMVDLRRAITLKHFDEPLDPLPQGDAQIHEITASAVAFIEEIDRVIVAALD